MIIGKYSFSSGITLFGLISAVTSCCLAANGNYKFSVYMMFLAWVCDIFGARSSKGKNPKERFFGKQLGNLCSFISFCIVPSILSFSLGFDSAFDVLIYCIFVVCGAIRLAHLNSLDNFGENKAKRFSGIPISYITLAITFLLILTTFIPAVATAWLFRLSFIALSVFFVLNLKIKKPAFKITLILLAVEIVLMLILLIAGDCKTLNGSENIVKDDTQTTETSNE